MAHLEWVEWIINPSDFKKKPRILRGFFYAETVPPDSNLHKYSSEMVRVSILHFSFQLYRLVIKWLKYHLRNDSRERLLT